ncbi:hypothetical protein GCM10010472_38530 [Pseudonocardia halophobica]|uniref:Uncharacterized protein n=1 Tax=Pseudonocardia halophobica TaxID=29401 RepID=A0A9W6NW81_9PSEU|nr:hypothetical protein GCM10017577_22980 [Pseudonocardia halophobica]
MPATRRRGRRSPLHIGRLEGAAHAIAPRSIPVTAHRPRVAHPVNWGVPSTPPVCDRTGAGVPRPFRVCGPPTARLPAGRGGGATARSSWIDRAVAVLGAAAPLRVPKVG